MCFTVLFKNTNCDCFQRINNNVGSLLHTSLLCEPTKQNGAEPPLDAKVFIW